MTTTDQNPDVSTEDIFAMLAGDILPSDIHRRRAVRLMERACGRLQTKFEAEFASVGTRRLINMMRAEQHNWGHEREYHGGYDDFYSVKRGWKTSWQCRQEGEIPLDADDKYFEYRARQFAFKKVLDARPHLANKQEGEMKRKQAAASRGHGPKKKGGKRVRHVNGGVAIYHGR